MLMIVGLWWFGVGNLALWCFRCAIGISVRGASDVYILFVSIAGWSVCKSTRGNGIRKKVGVWFIVHG